MKQWHTFSYFILLLGECYSLVEDYTQLEEISDPMFSFSYFTLSVQDSGDLYWCFLQGQFVAAYAYLEPTSSSKNMHEPLHMPWHSFYSQRYIKSEKELPDMYFPPPPGSNYTMEDTEESISFPFNGKWEGALNLLFPHESRHGLQFNGSDSMLFTLSINAPCPPLYLCGRSSASLIDATDLQSTTRNGKQVLLQMLWNSYTFPVNCLPHIQGPEPKGECYEMVIFGEWPPQYWDTQGDMDFLAVSVQRDGSLYVSLCQGITASAVGFLFREQRQQK